MLVGVVVRLLMSTLKVAPADDDGLRDFAVAMLGACAATRRSSDERVGAGLIGTRAQHLASAPHDALQLFDEQPNAKRARRPDDTPPATSPLPADDVPVNADDALVNADDAAQATAAQTTADQALVNDSATADTKKSPTNDVDESCVCGQGYAPGQFMLQCARCAAWFHGDCVGIQIKAVPLAWTCDACCVRSMVVTVDEVGALSRRAKPTARCAAHRSGVCAHERRRTHAGRAATARQLPAAARRRCKLQRASCGGAQPLRFVQLRQQRESTSAVLDALRLHLAKWHSAAVRRELTGHVRYYEQLWEVLDKPKRKSACRVWIAGFRHKQPL